ncbi:MAG: GNAT family N-acetyltransferase [Clostridium sp.]
MKNELEIKRKDGIIVKGTFKFLEEKDIDDIMNLQKTVIDALENKELFAASEKEEFLEYIKVVGKIIGCYESENDELIAMGVYGKLGIRKNNYGYDLELNEEELLDVGQIESTVVAPEYRGNSLQKKICNELEKISIANNDKLLCATVSPYNKYSLNSFLELGYKIEKDKLKYGGLRRYVVVKKLI